MWYFFFKQKTSYEMRISDWSSDVCSSDLAQVQAHGREHFLDLVQGLAAEVRGAQHLALGLLHQVADVDDVVVLQAVRRADRELQLVDLAQQVAVERRLGGGLFLVTRLRLLEVDAELKLVLQDARGQRHGRAADSRGGTGGVRPGRC